MEPVAVIRLVFFAVVVLGVFGWIVYIAFRTGRLSNNPVRNVGIAALYLLLFVLFYTIPRSEPPPLPVDVVPISGACLETPDDVVIDVNDTVIIEVTAQLDESWCDILRENGSEWRFIEVTDIVKMELSAGGFDGQVIPIGTEVKPLDDTRPEARWKWALKPDVPGEYVLTVVATALGADGQLYTQDIESTVHVRVASTFGYRASRVGQWLREVVETTQVIAGGSAAIVAALGAIFFARKRSIKSGDGKIRSPRRNNRKTSQRRKSLNRSQRSLTRG